MGISRRTTRLHALHPEVVEVVGQGPRVGDRSCVVAGPEVVDVEVDHVVAQRAQPDADVDVAVEDEDVVLQ